MSIHINPNDEVMRRLHFQQRISAFSSMVVSILCIALVGIVLALALLPGITNEPPEIVTRIGPDVIDVPDDPKPVMCMKPVPSAPVMPGQRMIVSNSAAPIAIEMPEESLEFDGLGSMAGDFGDNWPGVENEPGKGGDGGAFGSPGESSGGLEGKLYDFKQKSDGSEAIYDLADRADFVDRFVRLHRAKFSEASLSRHFQAPNSLFLTHLAIAPSPASSGPEFFGARGVIKPSGWLVHYSGRITVPKSGSYRFSGLGDDCMVVTLNGRTRLVACWSDIQEAMAGRWEPGKPTGSFESPFSGMRLVYGDWVKLRAGDTVEIDLAIGERPGGKVGFVLHIEEKGVNYRKASDGRPILPLFATSPISADEKSRIIREFGAYEFDWENIPVFKVK